MGSPERVGEKILDGFQDLLHRMRSGQPIPVTEMRRVTTPDGRTMIVSEFTEITFGEHEDGEEGSEAT